MGRLKALIIEEDEIAKKRILDLLQNGFSGLEYAFVSDPEEFRNALRDNTWDTIISNNRLSKINATQALNEIQNSGRYIPLIVISDSDSAGNAVELLQAGATGYILMDDLGRLNTYINKAIQACSDNKDSRVMKKKNGKKIRTYGNNAHAVGSEQGSGRIIDNPTGNENATSVESKNSEIEKLLQEINSLRAENENLKNQVAQLESNCYRWKSVLDCIPDEVWFCDVDLHLSLINEPDKNHSIFHGIDNLHVLKFLENLDVHNTDGTLRPLEDAPMIRAMKGKIVTGEEYFKLKDTGEIRYRHFTAAPTRDASGKVIGSVSIVRDVTEFKRIETALIDSEHRWRTIFENAAIGIVEVDENDRFIAVNNRVCEILGYKKEELLGMRPHELSHPEDRDITGVMNARLHYGEFDIFDYEKRYLKRDGTPLWVHVTVSAIRNSEGSFTGAIGTVENIEERKRIEKELQQSREWFLKAFYYSPVAMQITRISDRVISEVNDAFLKLFEYSREEVIGVESTKLEFYSNPEELEYVAEKLLKQGFINNYELKTKTKSGKKIIILFSVETITINNENYALTTIIDITDHKRAENALVAANERFDNVLNTLPDIFLILDSGWRYVYINDSGLRALKKTKNEIIGKVIWEEMPFYIGTPMYATLHQVAANRSPQSFTLFLEKNKKYYENMAFPWEDGVAIISRDVTWKTLAEAARARSESFIRDILDSIQDVFYALDSEWRFTYVNNKALEVWNKIGENLIGKNILEIFPELVDTEPFYIMKKTMDERIHQHAEVLSPILHRWIETNVYPSSDSGITVFFRDMTDKKLAEKTLRKALADAEEGRNTLNALMEYIPLGITIADAPDVNIRMVSRHGQQILERSESEIAYIPAPEHVSVWGVYRSDGITPASPDELPLTRATMNGEIVINEEWIVTRNDGTLVPILCNAAPIRDKKGKIVGGVIGWQDITERKLFEERLKLSESRFRLALDHSPVSVFTMDKDLRYTWIYQSLFSISNQDFIGKNDYDMFPTDVAEMLIDIKYHAIESGEPWHDKISFRLNGMEYHIDMSVEPIFNEKNEIMGLACAAVDITDLVRLEEEKNKHEIEQLLERAARLASVGVIAGGITHEINQPLNAIRLGVDGTLLWNKRNNNVLPGILVEMLQGVSQGVLKIDEIIRGMRSFWASMGNEKTDLFDLNKTIETVLSFNSQKISNHFIELKLELHPNSLNIKGDVLQIELALTNIINNALQALDSVQKKDKSITIRSYLLDNKPVIEIEDNATGLPDIPEDKLYDPFFTTKPPSIGSGLGLAIVKMFLTKHKGTIKAFNNESGGATFRMVFNVQNQ